MPRSPGTLPIFKIGLIDAKTNEVVHSRFFFEPFDLDLAEAIIASLKGKEVGIFAGRKAVEEAVREAVAEAAQEIKKRSVFAA